MSSSSSIMPLFMRFSGAAACAVVVTTGVAGAASAQQAPLLADLVDSAAACTFRGEPILAEGTAICSAELRIAGNEVRFGAETARALPQNNIAFNPQGKAGCVDAAALPPDPVTYNCRRTMAQDPLYSQCVVEIGVAAGDHGLLNEAACLLRRPITFQVRDLDNAVVFSDNVNVVECLVDPADRAPRDDLTAGEPVNVCTVGVDLRQRVRRSPLAGAESGWRVRITQNVTNPIVPDVTSPFVATLEESLF